MNDQVLKKVNHFRQIAKAGTTGKLMVQTQGSKDSLSIAIRNAKEASIFLNELNAIVKASSNKK